MEVCRAMRHWSPVKALCLLGQRSTFSAKARPFALVRMSTAAAHRQSTVGQIKRSLMCASFAAASGERPYRRAYDGLLLDAGGTLLQLARPVEETYATIGRKFGIDITEREIKQGFKRAFAAPWPEKLRYQHYAHGDAWRLPAGAYEGMHLLKDAGVKLAVVSNFDNRLRKLLNDLGVAQLFDAIVISSEVGYEKPSAGIFLTALDHIGIEAGKVVHVGDDQKVDKAGANSVGIDCWLWGSDVKSFSEICKRILIADS